MGSRSKLVARTILRSISHHRNATVPVAASAAHVVRDELNVAGNYGVQRSSSEHNLSNKMQARGGPVWFFAAAGLMGFSTTTVGSASPHSNEEEKGKVAGETEKPSSKPRVIFVLGGPGSGKGTQCAKIVDNYGFVHLSAGDLLRAEIKSGSPNGNMIQTMIKDGKIVPSEVTVNLLLKAMNESENDKFLIDGFPRNEENRVAFERVTGLEPEFILFFDCPLLELEKRLLGRNEGRVDDNIETIRKRFKVFIESSLPVIDHYDKMGKTRKVNATRSREEVFDTIEPLFKPFIEKSSCDGSKDSIIQYSSVSVVRD